MLYWLAKKGYLIGLLSAQTEHVLSFEEAHPCHIYPCPAVHIPSKYQASPRKARLSSRDSLWSAMENGNDVTYHLRQPQVNRYLALASPGQQAKGVERQTGGSTTDCITGLSPENRGDITLHILVEFKEGTNFMEDNGRVKYTLCVHHTSHDFCPT